MGQALGGRAASPSLEEPEAAERLLSAVMDGDCGAVVSVLSAGGNPDARCLPCDPTPLMVAIRRGRAAEALALVEWGANVSKLGPGRCTPLCLAARYGREDVVAPLVAAGADMSVRDGFGDTPLTMAISLGHADTVGALLRAGADPSARDARGYSPLRTARWARRDDIVTLLLEAGAAEEEMEDTTDVCSQPSPDLTTEDIECVSANLAVANGFIDDDDFVAGRGLLAFVFETHPRAISLTPSLLFRGLSSLRRGLRMLGSEIPDDVIKAVEDCSDEVDDAEGLASTAASLWALGPLFCAFSRVMLLRAHRMAPGDPSILLDLCRALGDHAQVEHLLMASPLPRRVTDLGLILAVHQLSHGRVSDARKTLVTVVSHCRISSGDCTSLLSRVERGIAAEGVLRSSVIPPLRPPPDFVDTAGLDTALAEDAFSADLLSPWDLRGWHAVVNAGSLLLLQNSKAFAAMRGRYCLVQDTCSRCKEALVRLRYLFDMGLLSVPTRIWHASDGDSAVLAQAAASFFGLPCRELSDNLGDEPCLIVVYTLGWLEDVLDQTLIQHRKPGQTLWVHAFPWVFRGGADPCAAVRCPEVISFMCQLAFPPWRGTGLQAVLQGVVGAVPGAQLGGEGAVPPELVTYGQIAHVSPEIAPDAVLTASLDNGYEWDWENLRAVAEALVHSPLSLVAVADDRVPYMPAWVVWTNHLTHEVIVELATEGMLPPPVRHSPLRRHS